MFGRVLKQSAKRLKALGISDQWPWPPTPAPAPRGLKFLHQWERCPWSSRTISCQMWRLLFWRKERKPLRAMITYTQHLGLLLPACSWGVISKLILWEQPPFIVSHSFWGLETGCGSAGWFWLGVSQEIAVQLGLQSLKPRIGMRIHFQAHFHGCWQENPVLSTWVFP